MPGREDITESEPVDIGKRYDIYVMDTPERTVVYRKVFFRGVRKLEARERGYTSFLDFIEIEQANGETLFLRNHSIIKFCEAGTVITSEPVS